jgi:hypothetical protein
MEITVEQFWAYLLQGGSIGGLVAFVSLVYQVLFNRVDLRIDVQREFVQREQGLIDLRIRVKNKSPLRDTSIGTFYVGYTSLPEHEHFYSTRVLYFFRASSIEEVVFDKKESKEKVQPVGRNVRMTRGAMKDFIVRFSRPRSDEYSTQVFEGEWHRYWPIKLLVETTHRDFIIPLLQPSRQAAEDAEGWFFGLAHGF